jgi:hypothetical protein
LAVQAANPGSGHEETAGRGTAARIENHQEWLSFGRFGIEWVGRGKPMVVPGVGGIVMFENRGSGKVQRPPWFRLIDSPTICKSLHLPDDADCGSDQHHRDNIVGFWFE